MEIIYDDNSYSIGRTPLIRLNKLAENIGATVLGKVEARNPSFSVKCRIGASMIWDAEERGLLQPGMEVIEPTSGNTGIALGYVCAARGYSLTLTMPETMSQERRQVLGAFGANLELTEGAASMPGAIRRAEELVHEYPGRFFMPQQFQNEANPAIHEATTGPEIWEDTDGGIDVLVSGVGTGGTITGVSRYLERICWKNVTRVAVEPASSPVIGQYLAGETLTPGPHKIQGIGAGFIPDTLDVGVIDRIEAVSDEEAMQFARRLTEEEGILSGISCGAAVAAALRIAGEKDFEGQTIVVVLPDAGERYLSTPLFQEPEETMCCT